MIAPKLYPHPSHRTTTRETRRTPLHLQMLVRLIPMFMSVSSFESPKKLPYFDITDFSSNPPASGDGSGGYPGGDTGSNPKRDRDETRYAQNEQNTAGLVAVLMVGVTSIFMAFAGAALCYRF